MTKSLARELAGRNVTVNAIAPGFIETAMTAKLADAVREKMLADIPAGRLGNPDDVAAAALFLASDAASYVTGEVIRVDGGMAI
jgi:3-oxoacyl-[acyl-carrier protein] reductase